MWRKQKKELRSCVTCRYWTDDLGLRNRFAIDGGQCRRFPPPVDGPTKTFAYYWCGEWQRTDEADIEQSTDLQAAQDRLNIVTKAD